MNKPLIINKPNVFSPNKDGVNDSFNIEGVYLKEIYLLITNRWGNVVFEQTSINPTWDGTILNGNEASDGVYFFTFKAVGLNEEVIEDKGFVELIRNK